MDGVGCTFDLAKSAKHRETMQALKFSTKVAIRDDQKEAEAKFKQQIKNEAQQEYGVAGANDGVEIEDFTKNPLFKDAFEEKPVKVQEGRRMARVEDHRCITCVVDPL